MASQASKQDFANFVQAAQQEGFRGKVSPDPEIRARLRDWAVESGLLKPGDVAPAEAYAAFMGQFLAANVSLQRTKTQTELDAEAAGAKLAEDRRKAGRLFGPDDDNEVRPTHKINEYADRDALRDHNAAVDAALMKKQNPVAERMERMEGILARMTPANIPGLVDESYSANVVTMASGRISHYQTQLAIAAAKEKNVQARAKFAEAARAAAADANSKRGL